MAKKAPSATKSGEASAKKPPRCLEIARGGITTGFQYNSLMSAMMSDLIEGSIAPQIGNAVCNAGGKLLKAVELQLKYGKQQSDGSSPLLQLVG